MNQNIIIISINRKMSIKILTSNNRIIIKENFAKTSQELRMLSSVTLNPARALSALGLLLSVSATICPDHTALFRSI